MTAMRVLIADDDASCRMVLEATVRKLGHECEKAVDGTDAWARFQANPPDVLITDWMMPGMDGLALCRKVREEPDEEYTYVILATALGEHEHVLEGLESGADYFLTKPISPFDLRAQFIVAKRVTDAQKMLAELKREVEVQARTDPLTGLGNRRLLHEKLTEYHDRAVRYGHRYAIAMCDLDRFKLFNDTYGHLAGDDALLRVGRTLQAQCRPSDGAYRYGGEEFVLIYAEQSEYEGVVATERLREAVQDLQVAHSALDGGVMTISAGVAGWEPDRGDTPDMLLARADAALYRSKELGRNQVTAAAEIPADHAS